VVWNPKFSTFDVVCQAFGLSAHQINLLATTFDPAKANAQANQNFSYGTQVGGAPAWTGLASVTIGSSNGSQKGSNGKFPDHEAGTVDTGTGPGHHFGRLYIAWAEFNGLGRSPIDLAYSDTNGASWTGPIRVSDAGHQFDQDATPRVGPDGAVYVSFINGPNEKSLKGNAALIAKSTDGGNTWSQSFTAAPIPKPSASIPNVLYRGGTNVTSTVDQRTGNDVLVCVTLSSTSDDGATWSSVAITSTGFDGDKFQACVQFVDPPNCGVFFLGDYIAVASTNKGAHAMWTGDGPQAMDVFNATVSF